MLPDDIDLALKHLAEARGVTISDLVREGMEQYVGRRAFHAAGAGASGRSDIAARMDEILAEELGADPRR